MTDKEEIEKSEKVNEYSSWLSSRELSNLDQFSFSLDLVISLILEHHRRFDQLAGLLDHLLTVTGAHIVAIENMGKTGSNLVELSKGIQKNMEEILLHVFDADETKGTDIYERLENLEKSVRCLEKQMFPYLPVGGGGKAYFGPAETTRAGSDGIPEDPPGSS